jgi:hypothetical protein
MSFLPHPLNTNPLKAALQEILLIIPIDLSYNYVLYDGTSMDCGVKTSCVDASLQDYYRLLLLFLPKSFS